MLLTTWFNLAIYGLLIAGLVMEWRKRKPRGAGTTA
jgi:hypothetical protein